MNDGAVQQLETPKPDNIADDVRAALAELTKAESSPGGEAAAGSSGEEAPSQPPERPRGPDGKFLPGGKEPPAAGDAGKDLKGSPQPTAAPSPVAAVEAPQHWPQAEKDWFKGLPSDELRAKWLDKTKSLETGYQEKFQQIAEINRAVQPFEGYLRQLNTTPARAFDALMRTHYTLANGTPEEKMQTLASIAERFGIPLSGAGQAPNGQPAQAEGDPTARYVQGIVERAVAPLNQRIASYEEGKRQEALNAVTSDVVAFENVKDDAGKPKHPYFAEVAEEMTLLALAERQAGRLPKLEDLYRRACRMNDSVSAKLDAEKAQAAAAETERQAKERADKARKAGASLNGGPIGGGASAVPADSIEEEVRRAYHAAAGRV